jgi:HEPN domain-containing protein
LSLYVFSNQLLAVLRTAEKYYKASLERIEEARLLHAHGRYVFSIYTSGLAAECMIRAFRILRDSSFDERHDLWRLWKNTSLAYITNKKFKEQMYAGIAEISNLWKNNYRFLPENDLRAFFKKRKLDRGIKGDFLKFHSNSIYQSSRTIIQLGGLQWKKLNKK